jgi:hypothetical protein
MRKPKSQDAEPKTELLDGNGGLSKLFDNTVEDIFRKFDL